MRDWVECPVCKEPDMECEEHSKGMKIINCTNHACLSNGGTYVDPVVLYELNRERQRQIDLDSPS